MQRIMLVLVLILLLALVSLQLSPLKPVHAATVRTQVTFKVETGENWSRLIAFFTPVEGASEYVLVYEDGMRKKFNVADPEALNRGSEVLRVTGPDIPKPPSPSEPFKLSVWCKQAMEYPPPAMPPRRENFENDYDYQNALARWKNAWKYYSTCESEERAAWEAGVVASQQAYAEAVAKATEARERARKAAAEEMAKIDYAEALGIPPEIHLGGTVEVPAQDPAVGREVVLEGCIKPPEGGSLEKQDFVLSYRVQLDEAYRSMRSLVYGRKEMVGNTPNYVGVARPDSQGNLRFILVTGSRTGTFQMRTVEDRPAFFDGKPVPTSTPSPNNTLTVKVVDAKGLKKQLTRYRDPACGVVAEYEAITTPSVTASSPQKQFDYPYGYLDYNVEYTNPSQTAAMKGAFLSVRANGQALYGKRLGDIAPGAKGTVAFRLEHQEKGLRLRVDGKVEPVHLLILGGPAPSLTPGAPYPEAAPRLPAQLTLQARLTASGVDEAASEPLAIEVVDWNKKVAAWAQLQQVAMFGGVSQAKAQKAFWGLEDWLKHARRLSQPAVGDEHESGVKLADEYETLLRRWLPALAKIQAGEFNILEASETVGELAFVLNEMAVVYRDFCSVLLGMFQEVRSLVDDMNVALDKMKKEDLPAVWELNKKYIVPASPAYKAALEKHGISAQASYQDYRQVVDKLPDQAQKELQASMAGTFEKLPPKVQDEYRAATPNLWAAVDRMQKAKAELEKSVKKAQEIAELKRFKEAVKEASEQLRRIREKWGGEDWEVIIMAEMFQGVFGKDALKEAKAHIALTKALSERLPPYYLIYPFVYQHAKKVLPSVEEAAEQGYRLASELRKAQAVSPAYQEVAKVVEQWADYDTSAGRNLRKLVEHTDKYDALHKGRATDYQQVLANLRTPALSFPPNPTFIPTEVTAQAKADQRLKGLVQELPPVLTGRRKTMEVVEAEKGKLEEELKKIEETAKSWEKMEKWLTDCASYGLIDINWPAQPGQLQISMASPVALSVTDDQGRTTGADPASGQVVLEIPGASYSGKPGEAQTVRILWPSGSYQVNLVGTGEGEYHLTIASGLTGEVILSHQGQIKKEQSMVADVVMVAEGDAEMGAVALVREVPAEAAEAEEAELGSAWALWAGVAAGVALLLLASGLAFRWRWVKSRR